MTPLIIIIALLAIAGVGVWGLIGRNTARKIAEQGSKEENERLTDETKAADENATHMTRHGSKQKPKQSASPKKKL
jgi:hypothetical protein